MPRVRPVRLLRLLRALAPCAFAAAPAAVGAQPADDTLAAGFDAYVARAVREWEVPGLAVAVVHEGRVAFAKGYGVRALGRPEPVDTATLFAAASTTKAMTAAVLGMLAEEGRLRLDDPVTRHLPGFALADPWVTREVTVRDLLTHRAGLAGADLLWYGSANTPADVLRRARLIPAAYSFRDGFVYHNVMYAVAGEVAAAAAGAPWAELVRTRIFAPLGMTRTVPTLAEARRLPNVATPHDLVRDTLRAVPHASVDAAAPAGAVWSSAADMARWVRVLLDSGRAADGRRVLRAATVDELFRPQQVVPPAQFYPTARLTRPAWTTYGLGWFQHDYAGRKLDFHTGSLDGTVAIVGLVRDARLGVVVLANRDHAEVRHALMYRAIDHWTGRPPRDWSAEVRALYAARRAEGDSAERALRAARVAGTRPTLPLARYAGTYVDSLRGAVVVRLERGGLRAEVPGGGRATLEHWHYDTFRAAWDEPWRGARVALLTFGVGADGAPARLEGDGARYERMAPPPSR